MKMTATERIEAYLCRHGVPYEVQTHPLAFTARGVAISERIPSWAVAKVVIALVDDRMVMLVVPAPEWVDLAKVARIFGAKRVRLAYEGEFAPYFSDCEVGAMAPFGNLYGLEVSVDRTLAEEEIIYFNAGTHTRTISIKYADFARLVCPIVGEFATQEMFEYA
jgi:Ala-tRNA(Pro) deacylase